MKVAHPDAALAKRRIYEPTAPFFTVFVDIAKQLAPDFGRQIADACHIPQ